jgi:hypothetical protein
MESINYDILVNIVRYLPLKESLNLLKSSKNCNKLYYFMDVNYGCNKISKIFLEKLCIFFNIEKEILIKSNRKDKNCKILLNLYYRFNNDSFDYTDLILYMIDNNIKTHDLFTVFLSKTKFFYLKYDFVNFNFYQKNIIQMSDMKYLLKNIDIDYLKILLKQFFLPSCFISDIICEYLKIEKIDHVKICIEYLFLKFFWKNINEIDISNFKIISSNIIQHSQLDLQKFYFSILDKYSKLNNNTCCKKKYL